MSDIRRSSAQCYATIHTTLQVHYTCSNVQIHDLVCETEGTDASDPKPEGVTLAHVMAKILDAGPVENAHTPEFSIKGDPDHTYKGFSSCQRQMTIAMIKRTAKAGGAWKQVLEITGSAMGQSGVKPLCVINTILKFAVPSKRSLHARKYARTHTRAQARAHTHTRTHTHAHVQAVICACRHAGTDRETRSNSDNACRLQQQ